MKNTKIKSQKPIEVDAYLKYLCPKCHLHHWLNLKECQTKNFKIVCDCNTVFKPKRIANITINYIKNKTSKNNQIKVTNETISKASQLLIEYGFNKEESETILMKAYKMNPVNDSTILVKQALELFGRNKYE